MTTQTPGIGIVALRDVAIAYESDITYEDSLHRVRTGSDYADDDEIYLPARLNGALRQYDPVRELFEPTDEDRNTFDMYNIQEVVSSHVTASFEAGGCAVGDFLEIINGYTTRQAGANSSWHWFHDRDSDPEAQLYRKWGVLWGQGINDHYRMTDCVLTNVSMTIPIQGAVSLTANFTGRYIIRPELTAGNRIENYKLGGSSEAEIVRLNPERLVGTSARLYINGVPVDGVNRIEVQINTGLTPHWRIGEGRVWSRAIRQRRATTFVITWLSTPRGRAEFENFWNDRRTEDVIEIVFPTNGGDNSIVLFAQARKNASAGNPGNDGSGINTHQITYVTTEIRDEDGAIGEVNRSAVPLSAPLSSLGTHTIDLDTGAWRNATNYDLEGKELSDTSATTENAIAQSYHGAYANAAAFTNDGNITKRVGQIFFNIADSDLQFVNGFAANGNPTYSSASDGFEFTGFLGNYPDDASATGTGAFGQTFYFNTTENKFKIYEAQTRNNWPSFAVWSDEPVHTWAKPTA